MIIFKVTDLISKIQFDTYKEKEEFMLIMNKFLKDRKFNVFRERQPRF